MTRYILYVLAGIGTIAVLSWLYSLVVPEPSDTVPTEVVGGEDGFDPLDVVGAQTTSPIAPDNAIELLVNGDEIFPPMLEAIRASRETVEFLTFVYWTGDVARDFADALTDAARRGVEVRVLLDAIGAMKMPDELVDQLEAAGVEVAWYHPVKWYTIKRLNNRTHRKVLVVDRRVAFTGGVGIAEEWTGHAQDAEHWRDNHFRIEGPVVRHLHAGFLENWRRATGQVLARPIPPDSLTPAGTATATPLATSPRGRESDISVLFWVLLQRAERSVDISTPYFIPDDNMSLAIAEAAERGVRVRLIVPGPHQDKKIVQWASYSLFDELLEAGVEIYEYQPTMYHVKGMVADGRWSVIGSANFDNRSMELNDELVLLVDSEDLGTDITTAFERDVARSSRLEPGELRRLRLYKRLLMWAGLIVREHL